MVDHIYICKSIKSNKATINKKRMMITTIFGMQ